MDVVSVSAMAHELSQIALLPNADVAEDDDVDALIASSLSVAVVPALFSLSSSEFDDVDVGSSTGSVALRSTSIGASEGCFETINTAASAASDASADRTDVELFFNVVAASATGSATGTMSLITAGDSERSDWLIGASATSADGEDDFIACSSI